MKIVLFYFEIAIKITRSAQNYRVSRVSGNTPIFVRPNEKNDSDYDLTYLSIWSRVKVP